MLLFHFLLGFVSVGVAYFIYCLHQRMSYWQRLGIACKKPNYFLGNLQGVNTKRTFFEIWQDYYDTFRGTAPFVGFYWFTKPSAFILEPDLIKRILIKDFSKFTDRGFFHNEKDDPLSGQLFLLDGQKWKNMRNKLSPAFTSGKIKYMFNTVLEIGQKFVQVLQETISGEKNDQGVVEIKELLARFTTDVIGSCAFGLDCNSLKDPETEFRVMGRKSFTQQRHNMLVLAFLFNSPDLARKLHMKQTEDDIEEFYLRIVRETVKYREENNIRRNDFMDMLIDLKNNKLLKSEDGVEMISITLEEMAAQAFVFFAAGFETSSTTMGFALLELAQHQDIQNKARIEINTILNKNNGQLNYECVHDLVYLNQVISETLRLYTVLPIINRCCLEDYVVSDNPRYVIKKGMPVLIPAAAIHRDERYYPNPLEFNPDNFAAERVAARDPILWLPFGDGPRNCIGKRFGLMQTVIGLALLLQQFKFDICDKTEIPPEYNKKGFLISTKEGIYLKVTQIK